MTQACPGRATGITAAGLGMASDPTLTQEPFLGGPNRAGDASLGFHRKRAAVESDQQMRQNSERQEKTQPGTERKTKGGGDKEGGTEKEMGWGGWGGIGRDGAGLSLASSSDATRPG